MMKSTYRSTTAPGIAFKTLLLSAKASILHELIGPSIIETIRGLEPNIISSERLGELATRLIDPIATLRNKSERELIIRMLPLPKARELGLRLGASNVRTLYDDLCNKAADAAALEILYSFFGVVRTTLVQTDVFSDTQRAYAAYSLFDHQRVAAEQVINSLSCVPHKTVLHMPTGSGKTRTAMHIVANHLNKQKPTVVCWLAQNAELLDQAAEEFENAWNFLGNRETGLIRYWGNRRPDILDLHDGLIVAGLGKMSALDSRDPAYILKLADRVSLTVIDEAHQAIAPTYSTIITALHSKRPNNALLGLTATPGRSWSDICEDQKLSDYFYGRKVTLNVKGYEDSVSNLIDNKYLARPLFRTLNSDTSLSLSETDIKKLSLAIDIPDNILTRLGADTQRNLKILTAVEDLLVGHRRVIVFAPSVENAQMLSAILSVRGHESHVVTGTSNKTERERIIRRFKSNAMNPIVIFNYGVLTTGFDAPATSAAVIARPTRSLVLYSQMVGRATRGTRAGGNEEAEIVTVVDTQLPGFGDLAEAFKNWEDVWIESN